VRTNQKTWWIARKYFRGWLIGGPPGIGKATLAYRMARAHSLLMTRPQKITVEMREMGIHGRRV